MIISKFGCPERTGYYSLASKCRFKDLKIHELDYILQFKTCASRVLFFLFLADLDKTYRNESEFDKEHFLYVICLFLNQGVQNVEEITL